MISYRSFLNTDTPALVDIWQKQKPCRSLSQIVTRQIFDRMVFAKPFFDPRGLILAFIDERPVGFIHVGFAPASTMDGIDQSIGILAQIRIADEEHQAAISTGLWECANEYFRSHGTTVCYAGSHFPHSPFYIGLYGGSRIPGIPDDDLSTLTLLREIGFEPAGKISVLQISLSGYRPPVNRALMQARRQFQVSAIVDPLLPNWWECCTFGWAELFGFRIVRRSDKQVVGSTLLWEIQPLSSQWGTQTMGLVDLSIDAEFQRQGLGTLLVGESLRHLTEQGFASVEIQLREDDEPTLALARKTGFEQIAAGIELKIAIA